MKLLEMGKFAKELVKPWWSKRFDLPGQYKVQRRIHAPICNLVTRRTSMMSDGWILYSRRRRETTKTSGWRYQTNPIWSQYVQTNP
jgi:hypothetical protein